MFTNMFYSCIDSLIVWILKQRLFATLNMIHTVDNQNVVLIKQHIEFCHLIYMQVKATITITRDLKQTLEAVRWTLTGSKISRSRSN